MTQKNIVRATWASALLGLLIVLSCVFYFGSQDNSVVTTGISSPELGFSSYSPNGSIGGEILPASCPSDLHDDPWYGTGCTNVCGNPGTYGCGLVCNAYLPPGYGSSCTGVNSCGMSYPPVTTCTYIKPIPVWGSCWTGQITMTGSNGPGCYTCTTVYPGAGTIQCNGSCSGPRPPDSACVVTGLCGTSNNACIAGTLSDRADTTTTYEWDCVGSGGGATTQCSLPMPIHGVCGGTNNACTVGIPVDIADNSTHSLWNCSGQFGGTTANCALIIPPVHGSCGVTTNSCTAGTFADTADSGTHFLWNCSGQFGGTTANCSRLTNVIAPTISATPRVVNINGQTRLRWTNTDSSCLLKANGTNITGTTDFALQTYMDVTVNVRTTYLIECSGGNDWTQVEVRGYGTET